MKKLFQTSWHNIPFASFTNISSVKLADDTFYNKYYREFFKRYEQWDNLNPEWIELKLQIARFLEARIKPGRKSKILSIGCGFGLIEKYLSDRGYRNLEITEISRDALRWIMPYIDNDKVHIGLFPDCIPAGSQYDFIYLISVEYCFPQAQLITFLRNVRSRLAPGGTCLLLSHSVQLQRNFFHMAAALCKDTVKWVLEKMGMIHRGQLWGFIRTTEECQKAIKDAGFVDILDGFLEKRTEWHAYWIEGKNYL